MVNKYSILHIPSGEMAVLLLSPHTVSNIKNLLCIVCNRTPCPIIQMADCKTCPWYWCSDGDELIEAEYLIEEV